MSTIYLLIGPGGSGKDYLLNLIMERNIENLERLVQYTTRPIREGEIQGKDCNFVSKEEMDNLKLIERRSYLANQNGEITTWYYATAMDNIIFGKNYIGTCSMEQFVQIDDYLVMNNLDNTIFLDPIFIECELNVRFKRMVDRESVNTINPCEIFRRFSADQHDYRKEKVDKFIEEFEPFIFKNSNSKEFLNSYIELIRNKFF